MDEHGVVARADVGNGADAGHASDEVDDVERGEVAEVYLVVLRVGALEGYGHELRCGLLLDGDTVLDDLGREAGLGFLDAVLDVDGGELGVDADFECHSGVEPSGVRA